MNLLPPARNAEIVVQSLGRELLIYDLKTHQAYQLNETSMIVFEACGEGRSIDDLKRKSKFSENLIYLTLDELAKNNLLAPGTGYISPLAGLSRREAIRKVGLASMIALPVIAGITAPQASHAASGSALFRACATNADCGADAPNCEQTFLGTAGQRRVCCKITFGGYNPGHTRTQGGFASCDACRTALAGSCCSGNVTLDNCTGNSTCTVTCV